MLKFGQLAMRVHKMSYCDTLRASESLVSE